MSVVKFLLMLLIFQVDDKIFVSHSVSNRCIEWDEISFSSHPLVWMCIKACY